VVAIVVLLTTFAVLGGAILLIAHRERTIVVKPQSELMLTKSNAVLGHNMSWIAVKSNDPAQVAKFLRLNTLKISHWKHGLNALYDPRKSDCAIFVTPTFDGWVLIAGHALPQPLGASFVEKCIPLIASLSKEFGEAQYFLSHPSLDFFGWAKAMNGNLRRAFATGDEGVLWNHGRLTVAEQTLGLKFYELRGLYERNGDAGGPMILEPTETHVLSLAAQWSVNPAALGPRITGKRQTGFLGQAPAIWRSKLTLRKAA